MAKTNVSARDNGGNGYMTPDTEAIAWRIRFLACVVNNMHKFDVSFNADESAGFMLLLDDIADMLAPNIKEEHMADHIE